MLKATLKSGAASSFAHLFGRAPKASAKRAEEEDDKKNDDDEDKEKSKAKAEDQDDGDGDDGDDKKKDGKKSKKAAVDDNDGDDDAAAEDDGDDQQARAEAVTHGRSMERSRWVSVLSDKAATDRGETALSMLAETDLEADQIVRILGNVPTSGRSKGLSERMQGVTTPNPGAGGEEKLAEGPQATATAMMSVYDRAVGRSK